MTSMLRVCSTMALTAALMLMGPVACRQVDAQQVGSWREAVTAAREQCSTTFQTVNALVADEELARAAKLNTISEADFSPGLDADSTARYMASMDALTSYASAVEKLLSPDLPQGVETSLKAAGEQVGATANVPLLKSDKALSAALGQLGKSIAAASAQQSARTIMLATDPDVTAVLQRLADMLLVSVPLSPTESATGGIYVTVKDAWDGQATQLEVEFKAANAQAKLGIAEKYVTLLDRRAAALRSIRSLRASLIELAASHTAAAQGRQTDLQTVIANIREQVKTAKQVLSDIKKPGMAQP
jgi:hypothetical protein